MSDHHPSRREIITGRRKFDPDAEVADDADLAPASVAELAEHRRQAAYVEHLSKKAMACLFEFIFNMGQYEGAAEAAMLAFDELERLENQMTIYRDWSELSRLNREAGKGWVEVEAGLFGLLLEARRLWQETAGAFDITSSPLTQIWGFSKREGRVPTSEQLASTLPDVGMQHVEFDEPNRRVRFARPGISLNLGGIGKGYALDRCVALMEDLGINHTLVHGGQSSLIGRGERTGIRESNRHGWTVGLSHPIWPETRLAEFQLHNRALGTSGTGRQSFYHQGKRYGHIIDPRTGMPAEGILSSTVLAPTAAEADALATAFYVSGVAAALSYCESHDDIAAVLVTQGERRGEALIHSAGLAASDWKILRIEPPDSATAPD